MPNTKRVTTEIIVDQDNARRCDHRCPYRMASCGIDSHGSIAGRCALFGRAVLREDRDGYTKRCAKCLGAEVECTRLAQFENAEQYDAERDHPASDEARAVWRRILDKPHYALPEIQAVLDK